MAEMGLMDWQTIGSFFTMVGVLVAIFVAYVTVNNNSKNQRINGLNLAFQKFNNQETRKARSRILSAYAKYLEENDCVMEFSTLNYHEHTIVNLDKINPELHDDIVRVKSDFEEIAVMEKNGMIDEDAYFDAYFGMMLRCYMALHGNITDTRIKTGTNHYTVYYEQQCDRALWYWRRTARDDKIKFFQTKNRSSD